MIYVRQPPFGALCQMLWLPSIGCIRSGAFLCRCITPLLLRSLFYPFRIIQKEQNPALEVFKVAKPVRQPLERLNCRIAALGEAIVEPRQAGIQQFFFYANVVRSSLRKGASFFFFIAS